MKRKNKSQSIVFKTGLNLLPGLKSQSIIFKANKKVHLKTLKNFILLDVVNIEGLVEML